MTSNDIPAFPNNAKEPGYEHLYGMSLRDYFAAKALQGWISNHKAMEDIAKLFNQDGPAMRDWVAHTSYQFADAMLKARRS